MDVFAKPQDVKNEFKLSNEEGPLSISWQTINYFMPQVNSWWAFWPYYVLTFFLGYLLHKYQWIFGSIVTRFKKYEHEEKGNENLS
jgi:hypothetical protein